MNTTYFDSLWFMTCCVREFLASHPTHDQFSIQTTRDAFIVRMAAFDPTVAEIHDVPPVVEYHIDSTTFDIQTRQLAVEDPRFYTIFTNHMTAEQFRLYCVKQPIFLDHPPHPIPYPPPRLDTI
jgi:hypothetical protein